MFVGFISPYTVQYTGYELNKTKISGWFKNINGGPIIGIELTLRYIQLVFGFSHLSISKQIKLFNC